MGFVTCVQGMWRSLGWKPTILLGFCVGLTLLGVWWFITGGILGFVFGPGTLILAACGALGAVTRNRKLLLWYMLGAVVLLIMGIVEFFLCLSGSCIVVTDILNALSVSFYVGAVVIGAINWLDTGVDIYHPLDSGDRV